LRHYLLRELRAQVVLILVPHMVAVAVVVVVDKPELRMNMIFLD
jgi:hypothetical protein